MKIIVSKLALEVAVKNLSPRKERTKELSEELLLLKIKSARAAGGYGRMSYNVKLY